jgi:hypothetical protein
MLAHQNWQPPPTQSFSHASCTSKKTTVALFLTGGNRLPLFSMKSVALFSKKLSFITPQLSAISKARQPDLSLLRGDA